MTDMYTAGCRKETCKGFDYSCRSLGDAPSALNGRSRFESGWHGARILMDALRTGCGSMLRRQTSFIDDMKVHVDNYAALRYCTLDCNRPQCIYPNGKAIFTIRAHCCTLLLHRGT